MVHLQRATSPRGLGPIRYRPWMAVFSRYSKVIEADGNPMSVRSALQLINQVLDEILERGGELLIRIPASLLPGSRHTSTNEGPFGEADNLARARNVSVAGVQQAGILHSAAGKVHLYTRADFPPDWDPVTDKRLTVWEATQHLIKRSRGGRRGGSNNL